jgi:hypothetical protein
VQGLYSSHFVCFACNKGFKRRIFDEANREWQETWKTTPACDCGAMPFEVSQTLRCPPKSHAAAWRLLKRLVCSTVAFPENSPEQEVCRQFPEYDVFKNAKAGTLAYFWRQRGPGCTLHLSDAKRKQFWVPKHAREWDGWMAYMLVTKLVNL